MNPIQKIKENAAAAYAAVQEGQNYYTMSYINQAAYDRHVADMYRNKFEEMLLNEPSGSPEDHLKACQEAYKAWRSFERRYELSLDRIGY